MKVWATVAAACISIGTLFLPGPARAEDVTELWRTPFGRPWVVAASPLDGSCWLSTGGSVTHVNADGTVRGQITGLSAWSLAVSASDGSWWAAGPLRGAVVHYSKDDELLWSAGVAGAMRIAANSRDGTCWVVTEGGSLLHLDANGVQLSSADGFLECTSIAVNSTDDSYWVARDQTITHFSAAGEELWSGTYSGTSYMEVAVDPTDGSCWASSGRSPLVLHIAADGSQLPTITPPGIPRSVSVDPTDGSCWVSVCGACTEADYITAVLHLSADGTQVSISEGFIAPVDVAASSVDGTCWVGDWDASSLIHLAADGAWDLSASGYQGPWSLSVNPTDSSCWMADGKTQRAVHLGPTGGEVWSSRGNDLLIVDSVSVDPGTGACWTVDAGTAQVARVLADGSDFWSDPLLSTPSFDWTCEFPGGFAPSVSASALDGSGWVSDCVGGKVLHLAADGGQLSVGEGLTNPGPVATNAKDGSCWVADDYALTHLSSTGEEIWSGPYNGLISLSVNSRDGSVWGCSGMHQAAAGPIGHFAQDGTRLWTGGLPGAPYVVAVNPTDGSCWVAAERQVAHFSVSGEMLSSYPACCPRALSVDPTDGSCWVGECRSGQVFRLAVSQAAHNLYVTPNSPNPAAVASRGSTNLSAIAVDSEDHGVASWTWSDGGAGGSFSPSANAATPTYTAPQNLTGSDVGVPLTVTITCAGDPPLSASASVSLVVHTEYLLTLSRSGSGFAKVNGVTHPLPWAGAFAPGENVTLEAAPSPGWEFAGWTGDRIGAGTVTLVMDSNHSMIAEFALIPGIALSFPVDYPQQEFAGWTGWASVPASGWEYGPPVAGGGQPIGDGGAILGADPGTSHSGGSIIGYVIGGNYQPGMSPQYLTTPPLDFRGRQNVSLHFWRWLAVEDQAFGTAAVEVNTGSGWQQLWINPTGSPPIYTFDTAWTEVEYPLPQADGKANVQVRWQMGGTDAWTIPTEYGGWSLDDISFDCAADSYHAEEFLVTTYRLWEQATMMGAAGWNTGESTWDDSFGLRARAEHTPTGAWGVDYVPLSSPYLAGGIPPGGSWSCEAELTAPPVSTIAYAAPVDPRAAGRDATLPCEWGVWQENTGFLHTDSPAVAPVTISRFDDVQPYSEGGWARFYVEELAGAVPEIVHGYGSGNYKPQDPVTRDQLAVYIARAIGLGTDDATGAIFQDVPADSWAAGAIEACANAGIIGGYPNYSFHPTEPVTRAGMCKFIANGRAYVDPSFQWPMLAGAGPFPDVTADHWAALWVAACKQAGIVQGYPNGNFEPDEGVNRGQMAVFVWRAFLRDRESVVVLGGPTLSRYAPTVTRCAVGSVSSATIGDTLHASVLLDAVRLVGSAQTVRFDLWRVVSEGMVSPVGSFTASLDAAQVSAAHQAAIESGSPYLPITTPIATTGLEPGEYLLMTHINDVEVARQVHLTLTAPTP